MRTDVEILVEKILNANNLYRKGSPIMTDAEYDSLIDDLREIEPDHMLLRRSVIESVKGKDRVSKLPLPMFSLEKVKTMDEVISWLKWLKTFPGETKLVLTPKYDGISLLTETGLYGKAWTRGDGDEGQESSERFKLLWYRRRGMIHLREIGVHYCWGEAIMRKDEFKPYLESGEYKTARNMVAGQFNGDKWRADIMTKIDYVIYGCDLDLDKSIQMAELKQVSDIKYEVTTVHEILDNPDIFQQLYDEWGDVYNIDGIVMEISSVDLRKELGRLPNGNPRYAVAVKFPEWNDSKLTKVTGITWKISKDGLSKPVINIEPVELAGATVTNVTGHNAAYIVDNCICEGANIKVRRSGDVIPKHDKTIMYDAPDYEKMRDDMIICPSCRRPLRWDKNLVELVCVNRDCKEKIIARNLFFFVTMGIEEIGEPTVKKLYENGYKTIRDILSMSKEAWTKIEGLGVANYDKIFLQIERIGMFTEIPLARLLTACNVFGGAFGEKTCQLIFDNIDDVEFDEIWRKMPSPEHRWFDLENRLREIKGIGAIVASKFLSSMIELDKDMIPLDKFKTYIRKKRTACQGKSYSICFSGVRDKSLESELEGRGHKIVSGVSKNTDILIVKDVNGNSSKINKAKELGVDILSIDDREGILSKING